MTAFQHVRRIDLARHFDEIYPEMCKVDPAAFAPFSKKQIFRNIRAWHTYGIYLPDVSSLIGVFWRAGKNNEVHVLLFEEWRGRWPLRTICSQMLDIWFSECTEVVAEIEDRHHEARRLFAFVGAEYLGFEDDYHKYRMTAAHRRV